MGSKLENKNPSIVSPGFSFRIRGFGPFWFVIFVTLLIFFASQFIAALIAAITIKIINPGTSLETVFDQSVPAQFFYILIAELLAVFLTILVVRRVNKQGLSAIGLGRWPQIKDIGKALLGFGVFYGLLIVAAVLIGLFAPSIKTDQPQEIGFDVLNSPLDYFLAFTALALLPPIGEEVLMRGYLYSGLRSRWAFLPAMLVTSLLFGLAHVSSGSGGSALWAAGIDTFLLSLVLVYLREKTRALYAGMLLHALNNTFAFIAFIR